MSTIRESSNGEPKPEEDFDPSILITEEIERDRQRRRVSIFLLLLMVASVLLVATYSGRQFKNDVGQEIQESLSKKEINILIAQNISDIIQENREIKLRFQDSLASDAERSRRIELLEKTVEETKNKLGAASLEIDSVQSAVNSLAVKVEDLEREVREDRGPSPEPTKTIPAHEHQDVVSQKLAIEEATKKILAAEVEIESLEKELETARDRVAEHKRMLETLKPSDTWVIATKSEINEYNVDGLNLSFADFNRRLIRDLKVSKGEYGESWKELRYGERFELEAEGCHYSGVVERNKASLLSRSRPIFYIWKVCTLAR